MSLESGEDEARLQPVRGSLPGSVIAFRVVYAVLVVQFVIPAISYIASPETALGTIRRVQVLLGGAAGDIADTGHVWHMLAVGNVMTLGFLCALLLADVVRFYPVLPGLAFLKGFSAIYSLCIAASGGPVVFYAIAVLDGVTTIAMVAFAVRARRAIGRVPPELRVTTKSEA